MERNSIMNSEQVMSLKAQNVDSNLNFVEAVNDLFNTTGTTTFEWKPPRTCWDYWQDWYYPYIVRKSYPVYIRERSYDNGKKAYEIVKILTDKKLVKIDKVKDFIDIMDELIKIL